MNFRTAVPIKKSAFPIDYSSKLLSLGSCFAENVGAKFDYYKFQHSVNPFGIIFNPISIEKIIRRAIAEELFTEDDVFFHNDLWHSFEVHSELSNPDKAVLLHKLNQTVREMHKQISQATHVTVTLGTAWVYRNCQSKEIVANCHKVPQKGFAKELLTPEAIRQSLEAIILLLSTANPSAKIIFTVSPVRHIKDGFVENQQSKSHLITALCATFQAEEFRHDTEYFPSYEIMMDELRDYRFYAEDMLHPNSVAIDYIWERFSESYISETVHGLMKEVDAVQKALQHRPFNPDSESHLKFLRNTDQKIAEIQKTLPFIAFEK